LDETKVLPRGEIGILNVYTPNEVVEKCKLRGFLMMKLPKIANGLWMVEIQTNKSTMCGNIISRNEKMTWEAWKLL